MADYSDLIARLEKAEGRDRAIDADLIRTLAGGASEHWYSAWGTHVTDDTVPAVTASLDAAIALTEKVLPGWFWGVAAWPSTFKSHVTTLMASRVEAHHPTAAIALLIATLKALQSLEQKDAA